MLLSLLAELRVTTLDLGVVPDMDDKICRAVQRGLRECDVVITTGGSSVGSRDRVPRAIAGLPGIRWVAKRVRMRPGSPTGVATVRGTPVFVLPGPPVSALAAFISLVEPFLRTRGGLGRTTELTVPATLGRTVPHARGLHAMIRVRLAGSLPALRAIPIDSRNAGGLSSLVNTGGLAILEEGHGEYERGEAVRVFRL
jgi:molybdopterin molybdotransferase